MLDEIFHKGYSQEHFWSGEGQALAGEGPAGLQEAEGCSLSLHSGGLGLLAWWLPEASEMANEAYGLC